MISHAVGGGSHKSHERICAREQFILQAQRVRTLHPVGETIIGPEANPWLGKGSVEAEIDLRNASRRGKAPLIFFAIAAQSPNVGEGARLEADEIVAGHEVGTLIRSLLWRHHRFVKTWRKDVDQIDIACELIVLFFGHRARDEDAKMPGRRVNGINDRLAVRANVVDAFIKIENPVK